MKEINFIGRRRIFGVLSLLLILASLAQIGINGVQRSVDFVGGTQLTVNFQSNEINIGQLRDTIATIDKKAGVYRNEVATGSSFTIKIKNPEVAEGQEGEASLLRFSQLEAAFASLGNDEQDTVNLIAALPAEALTDVLLRDDLLNIADTDEAKAQAYQQIAESMIRATEGQTTIAGLAKATGVDNPLALEQGLRLSFPALNRVTEDLLAATLKRHNPLNRPVEQSYNDLAEKLIGFRETSNDFITDWSALESGLNPENDPDMATVLSYLKSHFTLGSYVISSNETFSPSIAAELLNRAWEAILFALIAILIYISLRFTMGYAVASVAALVHDVIIALGAFSLVGAELSNPVVAAFLTIVGYSLNDTIVVFDRIRENIGESRSNDLASLINGSINQTLSRTLVTSMTTLFVVVVIFLGTNSTLRDFAFPLLIGIIVGTYSSIFVASPILLFWHRNIRPINARKDT
jgi:preprotein translocase SecF subunit